MKEIWKFIPGHSKYKVSNMGSIKSIARTLCNIIKNRAFKYVK